MYLKKATELELHMTVNTMDGESRTYKVKAKNLQDFRLEFDKQDLRELDLRCNHNRSKSIVDSSLGSALFHLVYLATMVIISFVIASI